MTLYIQHGHGKSDKIETALHDGTIGGVVFGARNEKPERLRAYVNKIREDYDDCELLLDPQFYVSTLNPPNDRYLPEYPYYEAGRTVSDFTSARRTRGYAKDTLDYQVDLGLDSLVSPTVIFDSFSDRWHQIALNLADASLEHRSGLADPPPLLLSFVFAEHALAVPDEVNRFLDAVTQDEWNMDGFYLIVARKESAYNQRFERQQLANFLYLVYVLGQINELRVICGYSDFVGIPLRAAGATAFATGWSQSLRQFHHKSFIKRKPGGQRPRQRYSSAPLFNSIYLSELDDDHVDDVLTGVPLDGRITSWSTPVSQQHHWQTLHALDETVSGRVGPDLQNTVEKLREAKRLYTLLEKAGVQFDRHTNGDHLREWKRAIDDFQQMAGLTSS